MDLQSTINPEPFDNVFPDSNAPENPFVKDNTWLQALEFKKGFKLGDEQLEILNKIADTINKNIKNECFTEPISLEGSAGTGKSLTTSFILDWAVNRGLPVTLCAPTHKAALVLKRYNKYEAITIHSLLALSPKLDILKLDIRELKFFSNNDKLSIPFDGLVICDEASMVSSDLYDLLVEKCSLMNTQILFVSDYAQLNPVKESKPSKVFTCKNRFRLTKIYRQSEKSGLKDILQTLRSRVISKWNSCLGEDGSLYIEKDLKNFCLEATKTYKEGLDKNDILHTKILAYTNSRVNSYNQAIHKFLFNNDNFINKGELLMAYENYDSGTDKIYNSMDYVVQDVKDTIVKIPYYREVKGYNVTIYDEYAGKCYNLDIIDPEECNSTLANTLENLRVAAIQAKGFQRTLAWRKYYNFIGSFCTTKSLFVEDRCVRVATFKYGYATTVHRSQGSSYDSVYIDMKNLYIAKDIPTLRQLQYVGLSRTRSDVTLLL